MEYAGEAIRSLSMEGRMTVCNMSIEGGARAGLIAPDEKTYAYIKGRPKAPNGKAWDAAMRHWQTLFSEDDAGFEREVKLDASRLPPLVTWGTSPENVTTIDGKVPDPAEIADPDKTARDRAGPCLYGPDRGNHDQGYFTSSAFSSALAPMGASRISEPQRRSSPERPCMTV